MTPADIRIGIVGSGFISKHFVLGLARQEGLAASAVLTRSDVGERSDYPDPSLLTRDLDRLLASCDVVLECSGDPLYATDVVDASLAAGLPVVTMNTEFHITTGSYFVGRGLVTEAEGDQPGCQAALHEDAVAMGFQPIVYGNMKGFLNEDPTREDMEYWGAKQGISLPMVTSFTDGTKVQAEQALVANYFGAGIARPGLLGPQEDDLREAGTLLAESAKRLGRPISDYVLSSQLPHGVFLVAEHDDEQRAALQYLKMGDGPFYVISKNNILVHLEIAKSIRRVMGGGGVLLDNSAVPGVNVAAVAKHDLEPGDAIDNGIGSFDVRGVCVEIAQLPGLVPIGLLQGATVVRMVERGAYLSFDDVELPPSLALTAWHEVERRVAERASGAA